MAVLDHLVYAVADLDVACREFEGGTGVLPAIGGSHPGMGTHNALASFGDAYLELIAPDPGQPSPAGPRPFGIDDLGGDGLVGFAVRPDAGDTIDDIVARARDRGYDMGDPIAMSRRPPDGIELHWRLTLPPGDTGGTVPFVIDWGSTPMPSTTAPGGLELGELGVTHPESARIRAILAALGIGIPVADGRPHGLTATIVGPAGAIELGPPPRRRT